MQTCSTVEFSISEHFKSEVREVNGESVEDYKLTRFACYLVAMSGDPNKPEVAAARVYFANLAVAIQALHTDPDAIPRVQIRDDLSQREKSLSGVAKSAGVIQERYGLFQNAGYMGLYNMNLGRLKDYKGFSGSGTLLDFMGKEELAANLFRVTQTEAKIRKDGIRGQAALENAAQSVGREVRNAMIRASGTVPENLPLAEDIKKVKTKIKQAQKQLGSIDSPKKPKS
jgi:DNA-damage-inducible protein D